MAKSFQDQLLKAGLVNKQQLNESKSSKHKQHKQKKKTSQAKPIANTVDEAQLKQQKKDLELNQLLQAKRQKKSRDSEIKQLIEANMLSFEDGTIAYKFSDQGKIRQIYVPAKVQCDLAADRLQIVRFNEAYVSIPTDVANSILQRDPTFCVIKNSNVDIEDEEYADYKVPDDLIW